MNPDSNKMADQVEPTISTLINEKHLKQLMEDVRGSDDGNWWVLISALREWATWYFFQKYKFIRCFHCNNPPPKPHETLRKVRAKNHTTALFVFFSLAANLYYFVIQCIDVPGYFCSFSLLIRLAKLFSLLGHRVRVIMFIDIALWLSYCFHLSARRNVVSVQIRSNQFLLAPLSKFMLHCTYHS